MAACVSASGVGDPATAEPDIYRQLDETDIARASSTLQQTLEAERDGGSGRWTNADSGAAGSIQVIDTFQTDQGVFCRRYEETLSVAGREESHRQTACRNENGIWIWIS